MISLIFYFQTKVEVLTLFLQKFFVLLVIIGNIFYLVDALRLYIFRLVLSIDSDLHVFDLSVGCVEFCLDSSKGRLNHLKGLKEKHSILTEEDGNVVELCFLPDRDVFMVLLSTGTILFMSPNNRYTHRQVFYTDRKFILLFKSVFPPLESCSTCTVSTQNGYSTCVLDRQKSVLHFISIPSFDYSIRDELEFRDNFSGVELVRSIEIAFQFKCHFLVSSTNNFVLV